MIFDLVSPGYVGNSSNIDASRMVNLMLELNAKESKATFSLRGTPGTEIWQSLGLYTVRGFHVFNGLLYAVSGNQLYSVNPTRTVIAIPTAVLATSQGPVLMDDNGLAKSGVGGDQLMIVDGAKGYIYDVVSGVFTDSSFFTGGGGAGTCAFPTSGVTGLEFIDGYFVVAEKDSMNLFCSDIYNGLSWDILAVAQAESAPDTVQSLFNSSEQLFVIKQYTTEIWYNAGIATIYGFPFSRMAAAVLDFGTPAPSSVDRGKDGVYLLGTRRTGHSGSFIGAVKIVQDRFVEITPPSIVYQMAKWKPWSDVIGYCYDRDGHAFYVVTSPSANQTFVYDAAIQDPMMAWHERSTYIPGGPYEVNRHIGNAYANFAGLDLVGDYRNGNIYSLDNNLYTDSGSPLIAFRTAQILSDKHKEMANVTINRLQIDAEAGVGGGAALTFSEDGGHTWSSDYVRPLGATGQYGGRLAWRGVGTFQYGFIPKITIADPVKRILINGYVE